MNAAAPIPVHELLAAARRDDVAAAMRAFFAAADARIAALPGTCWNMGECCRFGDYGHRLFVTALEAAYYLSLGPPPPITEDACPHASGGRCHARDRRPLGCRVFYCDPAAQAWQGPLTEELLADLRRLHDELNVPYLYADWMSVLRAVQDAGHVGPPPVIDTPAGIDASAIPLTILPADREHTA